MKYFFAPKIHNGFTFETTPQILAFDEQDQFVGFYSPTEMEAHLVQQFPGILMPAFVNAHCHLELSNMKNVIPEATGLINFLGLVMGNKNTNEKEKTNLIQDALFQLSSTGCIAVGDIANSADMVSMRTNADMHFHTFVETMGFIPESATQRFAYAQQVYEQYANNASNANGYHLKQSIVPHAPYSVSDSLFELINNFEKNSLLSIHNEETIAENEYFKTKTGQMFQLYERLKIDDDWFVPSGKNSLPSYLPFIDNTHKLLLVHNTFLEPSDIVSIKAKGIETSICLCPNANLYIETTLPNIPLLANSGLNICIGTDSLASNHQLNVYSEVQTLQNHFPEITEEQFLAWASSGGAKALQLDHIIGSFEKGKKPGLVHIHNNTSTRII